MNTVPNIDNSFGIFAISDFNGHKRLGQTLSNFVVTKCIEKFLMIV